MNLYKDEYRMYKYLIFAILSFNLINCNAAEISATVFTTDGSNKLLGKIALYDTSYGLMIEPHLSFLAPGLHGLHLHQHADCNEHGMAAGGHFDPSVSNVHRGPYGNGHLGDLPVLYVNANGKALVPVLAPRLKIADLKDMAIMVHAGGDNYTDNPSLGGGGARIACGVIK